MESCHNCDKEMSPTHLCQDYHDLTLDDMNVVVDLTLIPALPHTTNILDVQKAAKLA